MQNIPVTYLWLAAGVLLVLFDALHLGGVGLFFAGLGAIIAGVSLWFGIVGEDAHVAQWLVFFAATALWSLVLWKPMRKFRHRHNGNYSNIVGETAYVGSSGLTRKKGGEVTWSGTIMKARLSDGAPEALEAGAPVVVTDIQGATLIVKPTP
ncbi:MAG: NfeD family protein [Pseudomonadota bacterium]|nr:NfeD family protein [Pseudomonadota bacterium]MDE3036863.1 NfeD family protein [Pseudomonadota bacterium]